MNYNEFHEYDDVINNVLNSPKLREYEEKFNLSKEDPIMYLAFSSLIASTSIKRAIREIKQKEIEISKENATKSPQEKKVRIKAGEYCNKISSSLMRHIFNEVNFFEKEIDKYNFQFSGFNRFSKYEENPYLVTRRQLKEYLEDSNPKVPQTNIEHYLKAMSLSNKSSKILGVFRDYSTKQLLDKVRGINTVRRQHGEEMGYSTYRKDYIEFFKKISTLSNDPLDNGKALKVDFLNTYSKYIQKGITEEELKSSQAYTAMVNLINTTNNQNCYITPEAVYNNLALDHAINSTYLCKSYLFKKAFREYARLSKSKDSDKYKVIKNTDSSINHNSFSGGCYNVGLNFIIKGYNTPFSIHQTPDSISELENKYGILIEERDIPRPFIAPFPYKYTPEKQKRIDQIQAILDSGHNSNSKLVRISSFSSSMLHDLDSLPKNKKRSPISSEDIGITEARQNRRNIDDDPCI